MRINRMLGQEPLSQKYYNPVEMSRKEMEICVLPDALS